MKIRGWLLMLLFAHVMVHPWMHVIDMATLDAQVANISAQTPATAGDQCELCRVGHSATAVLHVPKIELLTSPWVHVALQAVNYASLQGDRRIPSRAPPLS